MSKIGLHDSEKECLKRKTFPNYALMKISAYHKSLGDTVEWWQHGKQYDKVYSSKIFDFTPDNPLLPPNTIKGGTGYNIKSILPPEIDSIFPDYSIYPECDYAVGYITRGCPNKCRWCIVPDKEGDIKPYRTWKQLVRPDSKKLVLMDNNILACEYGIQQLESLINSGYSIDLNQGMDARLVNVRIAKIISQLKWIRYIRFSCDTTAQIQAIENTASLLMRFGVKPYRLFIYLLVTKDIDNAAYRVERLKKLKGITIYAQAERNDRKGIIPNKLQLEFAQRYIYSGKFRKETWEEYCRRNNFIRKDIDMGRINLSSFSDTNDYSSVTEQKPITKAEHTSELHQAFNEIWGSPFEKVESIEMNYIQPYQDNNGSSQPFKINEDKVNQIMSSAADIGIITPLIVRLSPSSESARKSYQIIAGHHRYEAAKRLKLLTVPCVVRRMTDDEAFQIVAESNIQRDRTLPSEYGRIFTVYMDKRPDIDMTAKEIADKFNVSPKTMYRYINVAKLNSKLQEFTDNGKILLAAADILSDFSEKNQELLVKLLSEAECPKITPALAKKFAEVIEHYGNDEIPFHEFTNVIRPKTKPKFKNEIYNNLSVRFKLEKSEQELDELTMQLLTNYFENIKQGE